MDLDLGFEVWIRKEKIRLARINAPELRGPERPRWLEARDYLRKLVLNKNIILQTIKDRKGKYGRYLGELWLEQNGRWINGNDRLVQEGLARVWS